MIATISTRQYAKRLGVSTGKICAWITGGELRAINVASDANGQVQRWRIPLDEVERFEATRFSAEVAQ